MLPKKLNVLATEWRLHEAELRADFQQHYGIDLDAAMDGAHTPWHIACLLVQLPPNSRVAVAEDDDHVWGLSDVLLATIANSLNGLIWGMGDPRRRGPRPQPIGPQKLTEGRKRKLPARVLSIDELMETLSKERR